MIAGALEFTLGMEANKFLSSLGLAGGKLISFLGIANLLERGFHKMWEAVEEGGVLYDLSVRTNTSVKSLYGLQRAMEQIGASAESVGPLMLKLQRQLGDPDGRGAFKLLGLDPNKLGTKEAVEFHSTSNRKHDEHTKPIH